MPPSPVCQRALRTHMNRPSQRHSLGSWVPGAARRGLRCSRAAGSPAARPGGVLQAAGARAAGHLEFYPTLTLSYLELHQPALLLHLRGLLRGAARLLGPPLGLRGARAQRLLSEHAVHAAHGAACALGSCGGSRMESTHNSTAGVHGAGQQRMALGRESCTTWVGQPRESTNLNHRAKCSAQADTRLQRLLLGLELRVERRAARRARGQRQRRRRRPRERLAGGRWRRRRRVRRRGHRHEDCRAAAFLGLGRLSRGLLLACLRATPAARAPRSLGAPSRPLAGAAQHHWGRGAARPAQPSRLQPPGAQLRSGACLLIVQMRRARSHLACMNMRPHAQQHRLRKRMAADPRLLVPRLAAQPERRRLRGRALGRRGRGRRRARRRRRRRRAEGRLLQPAGLPGAPPRGRPAPRLAARLNRP